MSDLLLAILRGQWLHLRKPFPMFMLGVAAGASVLMAVARGC